jgi:hypothetical protein
MPRTVARNAVSLLGVLTAIAWALPAHAEDTSPPAGVAPAPRPYVVDAPPVTRVHEGFYLRGSFGLGAAWSHRTFRASGAPDVGANTSGAAGSLELTVGGTPAPGLVLGGSYFGVYVPAPRTSWNGTSSRDDGTLALSLLGFTVDWYPHADRGFHLGGTVGGAALKSSQITAQSAGFDARGPALAFALGQDFWAGDHLSVGLLGRFIAAAVSDHGPRENDVTSPDTVYSLGLALSVVYQ